MKTAVAAPPLAKDLTSAQKRQILLSVRCPRCGSPSGKTCRSPESTTAATHQARYALVSARKLITW